MPAWVHNRAEHLLAKNPSMPKGQAFAIATQQGHALGKTPKGYGTSEGRSRAKAKYPTPSDDKKTANPGGLSSTKMAFDRGFGEELLKLAYATSEYSRPIGPNPPITSGASVLPAFKSPQLRAGIQKAAAVSEALRIALAKFAELTPAEQTLHREARQRHASFERQTTKGTSDALNKQMRHNAERLKQFRKKSKGEIDKLPGWVTNHKVDVPDEVLNPGRNPFHGWHPPKSVSRKHSLYGGLAVAGLGALAVHDMYKERSKNKQKKPKTPKVTAAPMHAKAASIAKTALVERLARLAMTDIPNTPRLVMRERSPQELAQVQHGITSAAARFKEPLRARAQALAERVTSPGRLRGVLGGAANLAIDHPEIVPMQAVPIPGLTPAYLGVKKGLEHAIDRYAPAATLKTAEGAPTRGGFMMASDVPPFRAPDLKTGIQKAGDMLPDGVTYNPGDFKPVRLTKRGAAALTPMGRLAQTKAVGMPKVTAPPGPSIAEIAKPKGPGFGSGTAGSFKGTIGGTAGHAAT